MRDDDENDDGDDDDGYPAYSTQSYSHEVGICRNDKGWEYDTVKGCGQTQGVEPLRHHPETPRHPSATPKGTANKVAAVTRPQRVPKGTRLLDFQITTRT